MRSITRRELIAGLACSGLGLPTGAAAARQSVGRRSPGERGRTFLQIIRQPDSVTVFQGLDRPVQLSRLAAQWEDRGVRLRNEVGRDGLRIYVSAPGIHPTHLRLRWNMAVAGGLLVLGDQWERSYGDLHWSCLVPERVMPWYFMTHDETSLHGYGVKTGGGALCFWQVDPGGVSLWLNVCNGGSGVELGDRELVAATVVSRRGEPGEGQMVAAKAFCATMCGAPRQAPSVIYGSNDWYYAYGKNSAEQIVRDAELMASVAPAKGERPFTIIDDGWENTKAYPDMAALAQAIRQRGVRPGLWIRPLKAPREAAAALLLPAERFGARTNRRGVLAYDPTSPEALEAVLAKVKDAARWGYELVKHDYTTFELFGQWGFEMRAQPTLPDWHFHDRSRTNAEIVRALYVEIRREAGDRTILIGCNTIGHLAAGLFEVQRTGDDTSGRNWERTRRMGINTLAYRLPQHRTFFLLDADCVPITTATPWSCNSQWLDLLARSGTVLLVSAEPAAIAEEQRQALRQAFQLLQSAGDHARPIDWQTTTTPGQWEFADRGGQRVVHREYDWYQHLGAWPYDV
jgi:alpha-galactosidase